MITVTYAAIGGEYTGIILKTDFGEPGWLWGGGFIRLGLMQLRPQVVAKSEA